MITSIGMLEVVREVANEVAYYLATRWDHAEADHRGLDMDYDRGIPWDDWRAVENVNVQTQEMLSTVEWNIERFCISVYGGG